VFKEIKDKVSISTLCNYLGIEIANNRGLCPIHSEDNPSFTIYPEDNHFFCFGCQARGDVIDLVKLMQNFPYSKDAAHWLAARFNITIERGETQARPKADIWTAALSYYRGAFWRNLARFAGYIFYHRHLSLRLFDEAQVGWADGGLAAYLTDYGFRQQDIESAGLVKKSGKDFFASEGFIFPIFLRPGEVGNFRFRPLRDKTKIFQLPRKQQIEGAFFFGQEILFGELPKILYLVEGEYDAFALRFWNLSALATCGMPNHEALSWLKERFSGEIRVIPDHDKPDDKGRITSEEWTQRITDHFPQAKIIQYPAQFKDYDDYLKPYRLLDSSRGRLVIQKSAEGAAIIAGSQLLTPEVITANRAELGIDIEIGEKCYYRIKQTQAGPVREPISNFRMRVKELIRRGKDTIRLVELHNAGVTVCEMKSDVIRSSGEFDHFLTAAGRYSFWGSHDQFKQILRLEEHQSGVLETTELNYFGHVADERDIWVFTDTLFIDGKWYAKDKTGKYLLSDTEAYRVQDSGIALPRLASPSTDWKVYQDKLVELLFQSIGYNAWLSLGWARACFYVDEVVKQHNAFPILYLAGKTRVGKTALARCLSAIWGFYQKEALSFTETTRASFRDYISLSSEVPVWVSEFDRENERADMLRSVYDRTGESKKQKEDGDWKVRYYPYRACLITEGQRAPEKVEIVNRLITVALTFGQRREGVDIAIDAISGEFRNIGSGWLSERAETKARFAQRLKFWRAELMSSFAKEHLSVSRLAQNYAVVLAGLELMLLPEKIAVFLTWIKERCFEQEATEERHSVIEEFIGELQYLLSTQKEKLKEMVRVTTVWIDSHGKQHLGQTSLCTGSIVKLIEDTRRVRPDFTTESINKYFKEEPYYFTARGQKFRREEASHWCVVLFTEKLPPALRDIANEIGEMRRREPETEEASFGD
jgi:hypothetical protein